MNFLAKWNPRRNPKTGSGEKRGEEEEGASQTGVVWFSCVLWACDNHRNRYAFIFFLSVATQERLESVTQPQGDISVAAGSSSPAPPAEPVEQKKNPGNRRRTTSSSRHRQEQEQPPSYNHDTEPKLNIVLALIRTTRAKLNIVLALIGTTRGLGEHDTQRLEGNIC